MLLITQNGFLVTIFRYMKKILIAGLTLVIVVVAAGIGFNIYIKSKIEDALKNKLPDEIKLQYASLEINSWLGNISLDDVIIDHRAHDSLPKNRYSTQNIALKGLSYSEFLKEDVIHFSEIEISQSDFVLHKPAKKSQDTSSKKNNSKDQKAILIDAFIIQPSTISVYDDHKDSTYITVKDFSLKAKNIHTVNDKNKGLPVRYEIEKIQTDSVFLRMNDYDDLRIGNLIFEDHDLSLKDLQIKTKYSRETLSKIISKERDHYEIIMPQVDFKNLDWNIENDRSNITANDLELQNVRAAIYRDKRVVDDFSRKALYSEALRKLPFNIMINTTKIKNASLNYFEKVKTSEKAGELAFTNMYVTATDVGNMYAKGEKRTALTISSTFMGHGKVDAKWAFDINNTAEVFNFDGSVTNLPADQLNSFITPNSNVELEGTLNEAYFTISGNDNTGHINMKMKYDDFKVSVLNEKKKKKWLISTIANLFIKKDSEEAGDMGYRLGESDASRVKNKSVFNFLWLCLKQGLLNTMTSGGKTKA